MLLYLLYTADAQLGKRHQCFRRVVKLSEDPWGLGQKHLRDRSQNNNRKGVSVLCYQNNNSLATEFEDEQD